MRRSFLEVAPESDFPIQNLPYGVFSKRNNSKQIGVAIGDYVLNLTQLERDGILQTNFFQSETLNPFIGSGAPHWAAVRQRISELLSSSSKELQDNHQLQDEVLVPMRDVTMHLPVSIGDYTDFYSSREHATNVGAMFRDPATPLLPNWLHVPVAYHGRASSIVVSKTPIRRPRGQTKADNEPAPRYEPSRSMDFELEVGCIIGKANDLGKPISIRNASEHIFGMVLVNDWSARDIQKWEYVPLGPFLGKNMATSISPWIVPLAALEPFRVDGPLQEPTPLPYLQGATRWSFDIDLSVAIQTEKMAAPVKIATTNYKYMYWNICQQIAHHTCNGCNLQVGDLIASGTISGPTPDSYGSMLELAWKGTKPLMLPSGEKRSFLEDGDTITIRGWGNGDGYRIGFGEVSGKIVPACNEEELL